MAPPVQTCPRCSRVNPPEARFCHHDGVALAAPPDSPPRLLVEPTQVHLGPLRRGEDARFALRLLNRGGGVVHGKLRCDGEPWLTLNESGPALHVQHFEFPEDLAVPVFVRGSALQANNKPYLAGLHVESDGGGAEVPVAVSVPVVPFPEGVLAGAVSRRRLAEAALANPREAAALFASGAVARWYEANGWVYPCLGPVAPGKAALQQFFEALELTTPPAVGISATDLFLEGRPGESLRAEVSVFTRQRKHVYARAVSDQPWLEVAEVTARGRCATARLRVPSVPPRPGETLEARLQVTANGGQRFTVTVQVRIRAGGDGPAGNDGNWRDAPPPVRRPGFAAE
jgi:hypothetical protein